MNVLSVFYFYLRLGGGILEKDWSNGAFRPLGYEVNRRAAELDQLTKRNVQRESYQSKVQVFGAGGWNGFNQGERAIKGSQAET